MKNTEKKKKYKNVLVIGGGTGTYTVLNGLRRYPLNLSVIVSMMDDGGSNRVIRDEFGLLPTSDIRQCIVALASGDANDTLRKLFTYRYSSGVGISGMTFGNLFMAALTDIYKGNQDKAISRTCEILNVKGNIIPVTYDKTHLVALYENGKHILGEHDIDEPDEKQGTFRIKNIRVFPKAKLNPKAKEAVKNADMIILGPGDFYTSVLCNVVVDNLASLIKKSKAKKVFVMNLMTKFGQTNDFKTSDYIAELNKYLGKNCIDIVLINNSNKFPKGILKRYKREGAIPVVDDISTLKNCKSKIVKKSLISKKVYIKPQSDALIRSLIRHDSDKLAKAIYLLF